MFARLFIEHPRVVGETYLEHMAASLGTARALIAAGLACIVHAVVPGLCKTTGSTAILKLYSDVAPRRFDQPTL